MLRLADAPFAVGSAVARHRRRYRRAFANACLEAPILNARTAPKGRNRSLLALEAVIGRGLPCPKLKVSFQGRVGSPPPATNWMRVRFARCNGAYVR